MTVPLKLRHSHWYFYHKTLKYLPKHTPIKSVFTYNVLFPPLYHIMQRCNNPSIYHSANTDMQFTFLHYTASLYSETANRSIFVRFGHAVRMNVQMTYMRVLNKIRKKVNFMANATFKSPSGNCVYNNNVGYTIASENNNFLRTMNFYRDTAEKWLYVNYPETLSDNLDCFANNDKGNKCLLRETVTPDKTAQLFFSHHNGCSHNVNYAVLLFNPNSYDITVNASNYGYARGWNVAEFEPWSQFFDSTYSRSINVPKNSTKWLVDERNIPPSTEPFSGNIRFSTNGNVIVTVCIWKGSDTTVIDGTEDIYPYDINNADMNKVYTGIGEGFFLSSSNTVTSSDLSSGKKVYYSLTSCNASNTNEIIPIHLSGANGRAKFFL